MRISTRLRGLALSTIPLMSLVITVVLTVVTLETRRLERMGIFILWISSVRPDVTENVQ